MSTDGSFLQGGRQCLFVFGFCEGVSQEIVGCRERTRARRGVACFATALRSSSARHHLQHATCNMQHATCNLQRAPYKHATCNMQQHCDRRPDTTWMMSESARMHTYKTTNKVAHAHGCTHARLHAHLCSHAHPYAHRMHARITRTRARTRHGCDERCDVFRLRKLDVAHNTVATLR